MISDLSTHLLEDKDACPSKDATRSILEKIQTRIAGEPACDRTDAHGLVVSINPTFSGLCGYSFAEIRGRKPGSLLQGQKTTPESIEALRTAIQRREPCTTEMVNYHKNQSTYSVHIALKPLINASGTLEGFEALEHKL
jgi:PAS domain S-box-containing protein